MCAYMLVKMVRCQQTYPNNQRPARGLCSMEHRPFGRLQRHNLSHAFDIFRMDEVQEQDGFWRKHGNVGKLFFCMQWGVFFCGLFPQKLGHWIVCFHLAKWNNISPTWIFMDFPEIKGDYPSYSLSFGVLGGVFGRYNLTSWEQNEVWFS